MKKFYIVSIQKLNSIKFRLGGGFVKEKNSIKKLFNSVRIMFNLHWCKSTSSLIFEEFNLMHF